MVSLSIRRCYRPCRHYNRPVDGQFAARRTAAMAPTHALRWLIAMALLHFVVNAQEDDTRYVEIFPGKCNVHDEIIISKLELHPQGDDSVSSKITGILSLANQLPCETQVYRYVYYWAPVGAIEMNVTSSLDAAQSAAGPELESMGLPVQCPVPPGDYPFEWTPPARLIMTGSKGRGRMILGFDAFDHAGEKELASCRFTVSVKRDD